MNVIKKLFIWLQVALFFCIPILLIATKLISFYFLLPLAGIVLIFVMVDIRQNKSTPKNLGFRFDNLKSCLRPYGLFTIVGLIVVFLVSQLLHKQQVPNWWTYPYYYIATIPFSFLQEFFYRGYLMNKLKLVLGKPWQIIVVTALLFAFLHVIYPDAMTLFPFGFLTGIAFATMYYYYPNLILITLSHAMLNASVVTRCFFSLPGQHGC